MQRDSGEDDSLLVRIQRGSEQALALFYDRHAAGVYSMALRVLRDPGLAEEIASDIFLEVWRDPGRFMGSRGSFPMAMAILARNRATAKLLHKPVPELDFGSPVWGGNQPVPGSTRESAWVAIQELPEDRRTMLEAALWKGISQSENPPSTQQGSAAELADKGLDVVDLQSDPAFARRRLHVRDSVAHIEGMDRLALVFLQAPETILHELVKAAVDLCGADSAGISVEQKDGTDDNFYHWVATAGQYSGFVDAKLPRYPSACGITLERGRPQIFRVTKRFFDLMGIQAPTVTDGMLLPWQDGETRGTIWIMAHGRHEAFDGEDCRMMKALASFAATGVKLQQQQRALIEQAKTAAEAALANKLAHEINNPLQCLMQTVFLFDRGGEESGAFAQQAMQDIARLSNLVKQLLTFPR